MNKDADALIELDVSPGPHIGEYCVKVVRAASGGTPRSTFTLDVEALADQSRSLQNLVLASAARARALVVPELEKPLRAVGSQLFQALFAGPVGSTYRASRAVAWDRGDKLRVVLSITAPELAVMPWEALYDDELTSYICRTEGLVRHIDAPYTPDPLPVRPPLRILGIVASPRGLAELNVDAEKQHLHQALAAPIKAGQVQLHWESQASWSRLHERLLQEQWHVLHFIGHGDYNPDDGEGSIALVGDDQRADWVGASALADLLGEAEPTPRVVVLNSCASGQGSSHDLFSGTAATLVKRGISAVAAMQFSVSDTAAVAFPRGFYTALACGRPVDEAVRSGRLEILGTGRSTLEWVTPILHVRGDDTELFRLVEAVPEQQVTAPVSTSDERSDLLADSQWADALSAYFGKRWPEAVAHFEALQTRYPDEARVATRLQQARHQRDIELWSTRADAATREDDWDTVVSALEHLLELDPTFPGAAGRLEEAREAQRRRSLIDEMTALHLAGQWNAVVAAADELARLDPEHADPNGIVSDAQAKIREARLADRYAQALNHLDQQDWRKAADLFTELEEEQPGYRDVDVLRGNAEQQLAQLELADKYQRATAAQEGKEWPTAATLFTEIVETDAGYRDAAARHEQCLTAMRAADVQTRPDEVPHRVSFMSTTQHHTTPPPVPPTPVPQPAGANARWSPYPTAASSNSSSGNQLDDRKRRRSRGQIIAWVAAALIGIVVLAAIGFVSTRSDRSGSSTARPTTPTARATTTTIEDAFPAPVAAGGPNTTIADYIRDNNIAETPVHRGDPGAPSLDLPMPPGWEDAGDRTPEWAYGAIVYNDPAKGIGNDPPTIIALMSKLSGNVDESKVIEYGPNELKNLSGYVGNDPQTSTLDGFDAVQSGGTYDKDGVKRAIAQKTVVIPGSDGVYVLQFNADGLETDMEVLMNATTEIDNNTTITP
jgi:tetratricopeptide (TPR) repeat protein